MLNAVMIKIKNRLKKINWLRDLHHWLTCTFIVSKTLKQQFKNLGIKVDPVFRFTGKKVLVAMVETNHYAFLHVLALAKALEIRGCSVRVLICDETLSACEVINVNTQNTKDACWRCRFNRETLLPHFGMEIVTYRDILSDNDLDGISQEARDLCEEMNGPEPSLRSGITQCITDSVVRFYYGAVPADPAITEDLKFKHARTALINQMISKKIDESWCPDIVLSNMSVYSVWRPIFDHFRDKYRAISMSDFDFNGMTFNFHEYFSSNDRFERYVATRTNSILTESESRQIKTFFSRRVEGRDQLFVRDACFDEDPALGDLATLLKFDSSKRNLFLFSNLYWDIGLSESGALYSNVLDWVVDTIELVKDDPSLHLYIKTHPAELYGPAKSMKGIPEFVVEAFGDSLSNVTLITPDMRIKPYALFPLIDCAILYQGTLGFELINAEIPIISCGKAVYNGHNFVHEPKTKSDYLQLLKESTSMDPDKQRFELLAYFYFIRSIIPWSISNTVYASSFTDAFSIDELSDLLVGKNSELDHLCESVLDPVQTVPEAWPEPAVRF